MSDKVTNFDEFKRHKDRRQATAEAQSESERTQAVAAQHVELQNVLEQTARMVQALEDGMDRELARALARGGADSRDAMRDLAQRYERLSWRLCGQLRYILDKGRKG